MNRRFHPTNLKVVTIGALLGAAAAAPATAQTADETVELDEVIVYGQKMRQSLQDTQASVGLITADAIEDKDIQSFRDAFRLLGNVIDADWVDAGFVIRGVNSEGLTPGGSPLATIYVDGAAQTVQGARRGARGLWDVQQVEVYRGPQSTLSGRASLAGAIYIETKDPGYEWDASMRATAGENDTREGAVAFGGPIIDDTLAFRIAAEYQKDESDLNYPGYEIYSRFDDFIEDEYYQIRGKLLAEPGGRDGSRLVLSYSFSHDSPTYDDIAGPGLGFEYSERRGDLNASLPFFQENREADNQSSSLEFNYPFGDDSLFTSLTTWADTDLEIPSINEGTPGEVFTTLGSADQTLYTQELRLNASNGEGTRDWVLGLYFASEETESATRRSTFFGGGREDFSRVTFDTTNVALFGEARIQFRPEWTFIGGGRVSYEEQDTSLFFTRDNFNPAFADLQTTGETGDDEVTLLPKAGIVWDFQPQRSLGLVVQRGYRSGGVGIDGIDGSAFSFDPEFTWTYEVSYRSEIFNDRGIFNVNVFYTDWTDQQVEVQLVPGDFTSAVTLNAGESKLLGGEIETQMRFNDQVSGFLSLGYVDSEFEDFVTTVGDFSGFEFPEAPEWTISLGLDYTHPSGFFLGGDVKDVSSYLARDLQNAPVDTVGNYTVTNVRAGYRTEGWSVTAFSDNVFDEDYFVYRDIIGTFDCCATLGARRVTGVTVRVDF